MRLVHTKNLHEKIIGKRCKKCDVFMLFEILLQLLLHDLVDISQFRVSTLSAILHCRNISEKLLDILNITGW